MPYKYNPKQKQLEVYSSIAVNVIEVGQNFNPQLQQPKRSRIFDEFYKDLIVNFTYSDRPEDYQASSILYICGGSSIGNSSVQELIQW